MSTKLVGPERDAGVIRKKLCFVQPAPSPIILLLEPSELQKPCYYSHSNHLCKSSSKHSLYEFAAQAKIKTCHALFPVNTRNAICDSTEMAGFHFGEGGSNGLQGIR